MRKIVSVIGLIPEKAWVNVLDSRGGCWISFSKWRIRMKGTGSTICLTTSISLSHLVEGWMRFRENWG